LDVLLELFPITKRWDQANSSHTFSIIELILEIINNLSGDSRSFKDLRTKAYTILILTCADLLAHPEDLLDTERPEQNAKFLYCKSLILIAHASQVDRVVGRLAESKLVNELALLSSQHPDVGEGTDLAKCADILGQQVRVSGLRDGQEQDMQQPDFQNTALGALVEKLHLQARTIGGTRDGAKRVKLTKHQTTTSVAIIHRIADTLRIELNSDGLIGLQQPFLDAFSQIDEPSQCLAIDLLSQLRCVREDLNSPDSPADCSLCNGGCQGTSSTGSQTRTSDPDEEIIWDIFQRLTRLESFLESKRPRIATMIALRRLVLHCRTAERLDLETSTLAQWCIQSLNSSLRELRIAAGRTLVAFILPADSSALPLSSDLVERNRQNSIALLKSASEQRRPYLIETCIMAWGQLGRVAKEDELNLILIQLLEYLGDSNNVVSAFAFNELVKLAESRATTPRRLFEPYWRSLAYLATKDMVQRPQRSRAVAELLQISVNELLVLIQTHALPWLVLYKRKDIIQKIAEARQERELWPVLIDDMNLGAILSILLVQETPDVIGFAKSRLDDISPHFHSNSLLSLLQSEPVIIAMELLMAAGDADLERKPLVCTKKCPQVGIY
jgi:serine/threonine-protein kinase ATR